MQRANLSDIQVFIAVVDTGSFVTGGRTMGLSRSAAGKAVARLEDRLGVRLLNRTTRALSLTEEGRVFYDRGVQVLASIDDAEAAVAGHKTTPRGVLRLTVPDAFGRIVILPLLKTYLGAWPDVQAEVSFSDQLADIVEDGFDLAIRIGVRATDSRLVSRVIARYRALLCAAPAYLEERGTPASIDDLADHDGLIFSSRNRRQNWRFQDESGRPTGVQVRSRLRLDSGEAIRDAALAGHGIAYLPDFLVAGDLASGRLREVLPGKATEEVKVTGIYPSKRLLEPRVRRFLDLLSLELDR